MKQNGCICISHLIRKRNISSLENLMLSFHSESVPTLCDNHLLPAFVVWLLKFLGRASLVYHFFLTCLSLGSFEKFKNDEIHWCHWHISVICSISLLAVCVSIL